MSKKSLNIAGIGLFSVLYALSALPAAATAEPAKPSPAAAEKPKTSEEKTYIPTRDRLLEEPANPTPEEIDTWASRGTNYFTGTLLEGKDYKKAYFYLTRAAKYKHPEAIYVLATMYYQGAGVKKDEKKAFEMYEQAAELGQPDSQTITGTQHMYLALRRAPTSEAREAEFKKALGWFIKGEAQGQSESVLWHGDMLVKGQGIAPDPKKGVALVTKAAYLHNANAHAMLASYYMEGIPGVVTSNSLTAYMYMEISRKLGNKNAVFGLTLLHKELLRKEIATGKSMAQDWLTRNPKPKEQ